MTDKSNQEKDKLLYPTSKYYGKFTPENLAFNSNLQEFANRIGYLCSLETNGKLTPQETYQRIKKLWKQLKVFKQELIDNSDNSEG